MLLLFIVVAEGQLSLPLNKYYGQKMHLTYFTEIDLNHLVVVATGVWDEAILILIS